MFSVNTNTTPVRPVVKPVRKVGRPKNTPKDITNEICVQQKAKGVGESDIGNI